MRGLLSDRVHGGPEELVQSSSGVDTAGDGLGMSVLASLGAHIAVLDHEGFIIHVNQAWERFALENGVRSLASVGVGVNYLDVCRSASGEGSEEAQQALEGISAVLRRERTQFCLEYACHSPDECRWFLLTAVPLRVDGGGAVVSHAGITERVLAEENLKETFEFFRALIENASDLVTIIDREGTFRYQSPSIEKVLGYRQDELIGKSCFDLTHPSNVAEMREVLERLQEPGSAMSAVQFAIRHKNGRWRILEGVVKNAVDNPAVDGIVITSRDVTERRRDELELREKEAALRNSHRTLQAVTARLLEAEERERRRLSRELHDDLNQKLAIIALDVASLAKSLPHSEAVEIETELRTLHSRLTRICGQVRTMAYQLHPSILDDLGLAVAIRSYCAEFSTREGIQVHFVHRQLTEPIEQEHASAVYRITQEALRNVAKHAGATRVSVSLVGSAQGITLRVRDNGKGFRVDGAKADTGGLGLTSMEERARMLGGSFDISSQPGKGTTITACIPWTGRNP
jgi:PAS domain S-box-containing protein